MIGTFYFWFSSGVLPITIRDMRRELDIVIAGALLPAAQ